LDNEWFHHFFDGIAVDFWIAVAPSPDDDVEFLKSVFAEGGEILDLACGAGRHTIPLARAGYRMTGVDLSAKSLALARDAGPEIDWQLRDMRDLPWRDRFDGAICFGNSFGYIGREGTRRAIAALAGALKRGGSFVLETGAIAESLLPSLQRERSMQIGDITYSSAATYDVMASRLDVAYTFTRAAERETKTASTSIFTLAELREMFEQCGFAIEGAYASARRDPFTLGAPRLILVARRS
jgi:SAM-dependent methyltransferase